MAILHTPCLGTVLIRKDPNIVLGSVVKPKGLSIIFIYHPLHSWRYISDLVFFARWRVIILRFILVRFVPVPLVNAFSLFYIVSQVSHNDVE